MELRHLRALVEVARCGGFSAAAKPLGMTQSAVSKAVAQLEHDCGAPLISRLGRGVQLTAAGELVARRAQNMLAEQRALESELAELSGLHRGRLRLGLPVLASGVLFAGLVADFRKRYPEIELELFEESTGVLQEEVRRGHLEIGGALMPVPDDFAFRVVREDSMMALLPLEHPLAGRASVKLQELSGLPVILFSKGFALNPFITAAYRKRRMRLVDAGHSGNADFIIAMVAAGLGVAYLPRLIVQARNAQSVRAVEIIDPDIRWRMAVIWSKGRPLSPPAQRWIEMVAPIPKRN